MRAVLSASVAAALFAATAGALPPRWTVGDPGQGPVPLSSGATGASQLSGLTWVDGSRYYAVADKGGTLFPLRIRLEPNGTIAEAKLDHGVRLSHATDLEGVVCQPGCASVLTSDEDGPAIREYRTDDGRLVRSIRVPAVYATARRNRSLESLSADPGHSALWTVNEETLRVDGAASSPTAGSVVRLQRFDRHERPDGQWAYVTDPVPVPAGTALGIESSGVSDLIALPDDGLIALERAFGPAGFRIRLYLVDRSAATDVSALPSLRGAGYTPVAKRLLWERTLPDFNFEGAALGPPLAGGSRSIILIADDGHGFRQGLYALTLTPAAVPTPTSR